MLRYLTFSCVSTETWCYATWSSPAFRHEFDATLPTWSLQRFNIHLTLRVWIFSCISPWTWRCTTWSSLAFQHELDTTLFDFLFHFNMNLMPRYLSTACNSTWTWCYAAWSSLAFWHELDATLLDLLFFFNMNLMLRYLSTACSSTWTSWCFAAWQFAVQQWSWCYAARSFLAVHGELDATLLALLLRFDMNLMLRCLIFSSSSSWTWCYATWSSLPFHSLALCYLIVFYFQCFQWIRCYATWSSLGCRKRPLAPKSGSHPQSNPSWSWNVIGRWIWAKYMSWLALFLIQSYQINLHCVVPLGIFFSNVHAPWI